MREISSLIERLADISIRVFAIGIVCGIKELEDLSADLNSLSADIAKRDWHTGEPTEEDWYFVKWRDTNDNWIRHSALLWNNYNKTWYDDVTLCANWGDEDHAEVLAWMSMPKEEA